MEKLVLGIDLGSSGVRIAVLDSFANIVHSKSANYRKNLTDAGDWLSNSYELIKAIPEKIRLNLIAVAIDGTSGTLLACDRNGNPIGPALSYSESFSRWLPYLKEFAPKDSPAASSSGSLARAFELIDRHGANLILRHQADWISGWILNDWRWGEESNNLKLGWDLDKKKWLETISQQCWSNALPIVKPSGTILGTINKRRAEILGLPINLKIVAGTTDANASVIAANPKDGDGVTILGTSLVLKRFTKNPINNPVLSCHRVCGRWLCGGASNAGAGILRRFFNDDLLIELSRQIDPEKNSGIKLLPLPSKGDRFPIDDPSLEPVLEPRPVSDSLYLHALLEGIAIIEARGWEKLIELGVPAPKRIISIGGGASNPQWRRLRERILGYPIVSSKRPTAAGAAHLALEAIAKNL